MRLLLLILFTCVATTAAMAQSVSVGVVGGVFKNGQMEDNYNPTTNYSFEYFPDDQRLIVGVFAQTVLHRNYRIEIGVTNTVISNKVVETVRVPQQNLIKEQEGKLKYGASNYLVTLSPAYQFSMGDVYPYIGVEGGVAVPIKSNDKTGYIVGGRLGMDVALADRLQAGISFNYGQITRVVSSTHSTNFWYYRVLLGLSYTLWEQL